MRAGNNYVRDENRSRAWHQEGLVRRSSATTVGGFALTAIMCAATAAGAQSSVVRVIGSDSMPIAFATVFVQGGAPSITDEHGRISMAGTRQVLTAEVRRIGYTPWFGKITLPDTATTITIVLPRIAQQLSGVTVTGTPVKSRLELAGFYDRWQMRQKGTLSATFIGPEEIEKRHPSRASDMLNGVLGVTMVHTPQGGMVAKGMSGRCMMAVLLDGQRLCPPYGCHTVPQTSQSATPLDRNSRGQLSKDTTFDDVTVNINQFVDANDIAAIEVYARGGNMPISLQVDDSACGVVAIWTGSRHP